MSTLNHQAHKCARGTTRTVWDNVPLLWAIPLLFLTRKFHRWHGSARMWSHQDGFYLKYLEVTRYFKWSLCLPRFQEDPNNFLLVLFFQSSSILLYSSHHQIPFANSSNFSKLSKQLIFQSTILLVLRLQVAWAEFSDLVFLFLGVRRRRFAGSLLWWGMCPWKSCELLR